MANECGRSARSFKARKLSALEVLESCITRVEEIDCKINALPEICFDRARALASEIDKNPSKDPRNLLGLPIAVKDYNDLSGVRTTYGSPLFKDNIPQYSDRTITRLEINGANPIAKSNVPEWAGGHTFNPVYGLTRNLGISQKRLVAVREDLLQHWPVVRSFWLQEMI